MPRPSLQKVPLMILQQMWDMKDFGNGVFGQHKITHDGHRIDGFGTHEIHAELTRRGQLECLQPKQKETK